MELCSLIWDGYIKPRVSDNYTLSLSTPSDAVEEKVLFNYTLDVNNRTVELTAGIYYPIQVRETEERMVLRFRVVEVGLGSLLKSI